MAAAAASLLSRAAPFRCSCRGWWRGTDGWLPAHQYSSGERFWLKYSLDCPVRADAVLVQFCVDGHYIGGEAPMGEMADGGLLTVRPVESSIMSQYGRDDSGAISVKSSSCWWMPSGVMVMVVVVVVVMVVVVVVVVVVEKK